MRTTSKIAISAAGLASLAIAMAGPAAAGASPAQKTTGSVTLADASAPRQYLSYDAFQTSPAKGSVNYTNFDQAAPGSGTWVPGATFNMGFGLDPNPAVVATYVQSVTSWTPLSQTSVAFSGNGATAGWLSTFSGTISGTTLTLAMKEISVVDSSETYDLAASGSISPTGAVTGTWSDNYGAGRTGTFVIDSIGHEVLHYVAPVASVSISGHDGYFDYIIPAGTAWAGTHVYFHVYDGGSPGVSNDKVEYGTDGSTFPYQETVTGGNLTVFSNS